MTKSQACTEGAQLKLDCVQSPLTANAEIMKDQSFSSLTATRLLEYDMTIGRVCRDTLSEFVRGSWCCKPAFARPPSGSANPDDDASVLQHVAIALSKT